VLVTYILFDIKTSLIFWIHKSICNRLKFNKYKNDKHINNNINSRFLEAPVSGSKGPAAMGTLIFLCAGSEELFNEIKDTGLCAMGKASHYFSSTVGAGTRAKLVVNSVMGTMLAAYSEGLALSDASGLDMTTMIDVMNQGAISCPMFTMKGPKMIAHDHEPNFPLKHAQKDMTLAKDLAKSVGVEFSVINEAEALFRSAGNDSELDIADQDFSAIYERVCKKSSL
jgi:3-hydroxyisobutyrate dehydrogenase-like beta-hydroxyacid dehydrogenase